MVAEPNLAMQSEAACSNGGCTRPTYRGKYCYRCWVGVKWWSITQRIRNLNGKCASYVGVPLEMTREEFIAWATDNPPPDDMKWPSLDRIVDGRGYRLDNIQWLEQRANSRTTQKWLPMTHRRCPRCETTYRLSHANFNRSKSNPFGFQMYCRECQKAVNKEYHERRTADRQSQ